LELIPGLLKRLKIGTTGMKGKGKRREYIQFLSGTKLELSGACSR
jgi:hypothetical protein